MTYVEHLHRRLQVVLGDPDDIDVFGPLGHDLLTFHCAPNRRQTITKAGRQFIFLFRRCTGHSLLDRGLDIVGLTIEEVGQSRNERRVFVDTGGTNTRPRTLLDVKQQTRTAEAFVFVEL